VVYTFGDTGDGVLVTCGELERRLCDGTDGEDGKDGVEGAAGQGCAIVQTDEGAAITCDEVEYLYHGNKGNDGSVITIEDDGYWYINGEKQDTKATGDKGDGCTVEDKGNRFVMTCTGEYHETVTWPKTMPFFIDGRDGKKYEFVTIGTQTWMAENLNYYTTTGSRCYDDNDANCEKYGRLYNWNTAMGVCPSGWHLPNQAEWNDLASFIQSDKSCANDCDTKYLKAESGWNSNGNGIDTYGFAALPGGRCYASNFNYAEDYGYWWSASENNGDAYFRTMYYGYEFAYWVSGGKDTLYSVRCVRND
jgi:uncharacterized protein (TIGR02145 family)